jgi:glycosyltransferase involved in cell wall biosynthesis
MAQVFVYIHDFRSSGVVRDALTYAARLSREHGTFALVVLAERQGRNPRLVAAPRLRRWLRKQSGGILLSMGVHGHPTAFLAVQGMSDIRRVYRISNEVAGTVKGNGFLRGRWMRRLIDDAARIILIGGAMGGHAVFAHAIATGKAVAIPSGVDRVAGQQRALAPSPHSWLEDEVPVVIAVGRLRPQKNLELLIEAIDIARRSRRLRLIIIGGGLAEEQGRMTALASAFAHDFLLAGETDNVFAWIARADVFALPSRWEGSSLALLEAMAVGTPVVASRLAGDAAQVLDDGRFGLLFDGRSAAGLAHDRVLPGDRADDYAIARIGDMYADAIAGIEAATREVAGAGRAL